MTSGKAEVTLNLLPTAVMASCLTEALCYKSVMFHRARRMVLLSIRYITRQDALTDTADKLHTSQLSMTESLNKEDVMESLSAIQITERGNRRNGDSLDIDRYQKTISSISEKQHNSFDWFPVDRGLVAIGVNMMNSP
uniref:Uncharacterized protein n=1 Tax=Magallana gigas TaxID=29159 RepID=A0A8W8LIM6_MAGGI